jgi:hypothetical protein
MRKLFSKIILLAILVGSLQSYGQFQNNGNTGGLDRSIGGGVRQNEPQKSEPIDYAKIMTEKLTTRLELDAFQNAVVKNLVDDFIKKANEITLEDIPSYAKIEKNNAARAEMEKKFAEIFTDKQKVLFEEFVIENQGKIKKSKKKKKKDTNKSEE